MRLAEQQHFARSFPPPHARVYRRAAWPIGLCLAAVMIARIDHYTPPQSSGKSRLCLRQN